MSLVLRGDLNAFGRMLAKAQALATGRLSKGIAPRVAGTELKALADRGKASHTNPQGRAWKATKDGQSLKWPGRASVVASIVDGKIRLTVTGPAHFSFQQTGWSRQRLAKAGEFFASMSKNSQKASSRKRWRGPARRILPKSGIPKPWAAVVAAALNAGWRSFMHSSSVRAARG